jgi:hypothetical protein
MLLHVFASLAVNVGCMEFNILGAGVSPESLINALCVAMRSLPSIELACCLSRSCRSSHLPTSLGSNNSALQYSETAWLHATWMPLICPGTTASIIVKVRSLAPTALVFFMHWLWCCQTISCTLTQTPSNHGSCLENCMNPSATHIFAVSFG